MSGPVGKDISAAILKTPASNGKPATYWSKEEQAEKVAAVYDKYEKMGNVWGPTAPAVSTQELDKHNV